MFTYKNGNVDVQLLNSGTKIRTYTDEVPLPLFPETIDLKITDYCTLGCNYCHESSTTNGIHANHDTMLKILDPLPPGIELAIGGGNPLSYPHLVSLLDHNVKKHWISNLTVNQGHLTKNKIFIDNLISSKLIKGIGISVTTNNFKQLSEFEYEHKVYHVIAGVNKIEILDSLINSPQTKILVLGYKEYGFGKKFYSNEIKQEIRRWSMYIGKYFGRCILSFDNLAIEQLDIKRFFTDDGWQKFYMGDDGAFSMYIDAVKQEYALTSRSKERESFKDYTVLEYFQKFRRS